MVPALVVTGHLSLIRSLGRRGVPVVSVEYDESHTGRLSRYSQAGLRVPHPLHEQDAFVEALLLAGTRYEGALLIPMFDAPLAAISRHKEALSEHYLVAAPDWATLEVYLDKSQTARLADSVGIPTPKTVRIDSGDAAAQCCPSLAPPYLVKPVLTHEFQSRFGTKMFNVGTRGALADACQRSLDEGIAVMVQEFIPGEPNEGAVYTGYFVSGTPVVETTYRKVRDGPPLYGSPRVSVTENIPEIVAPGRALMESTGYSGFACIEFKRDFRDGLYKLMEVNARHNLSSALHVRSGVDYPWIEYEWLVYGREPGPLSAREGVYWVDFYRDLGYSLRFARDERLGLRGFLRPYRRGTAFRTFDWRDPAPFLALPWMRALSKVRPPKGVPENRSN